MINNGPPKGINLSEFKPARCASCEFEFRIPIHITKALLHWSGKQAIPVDITFTYCLRCKAQLQLNGEPVSPSSPDYIPWSTLRGVSFQGGE